MADSLTYTVTTTSGSRKHEIGGLAENRQAVKGLVDAFRGNAPGFFLSNPATFYALSNIISVGVEGGLPDVVEEARRSMNPDQS